MKLPDMPGVKLSQEEGEKLPANTCFMEGRLQLTTPVTGARWTQLSTAINSLIQLWAQQNKTKAKGGLMLACGNLEEAANEDVPFVAPGNETVH